MLEPRERRLPKVYGTANLAGFRTIIPTKNEEDILRKVPTIKQNRKPYKRV